MEKNQGLLEIRKEYPITCSHLDSASLSLFLETVGKRRETLKVPDILAELAGIARIPPYLPDLARLEEARKTAMLVSLPDIDSSDHIELNPTLRIIPVSWKNLPLLFVSESTITDLLLPVEAREMVIIWRAPGSDSVQMHAASSEDLLALKIVAEGLVAEEIAAQERISVGAIDRVLRNAVDKGILLSPASKIKRTYLCNAEGKGMPVNEQADVFTLQWHITQVCDLHCKHCYDRTGRGSMSVEQGLSVLSSLRRFCGERFVSGHITFSGGNPFLFRHFKELYRAASDLGFSLAILGNPVSRKQLEEIVTIQEPTHFQVSLEGLQEHNDFIRGEGNFENVIGFLDTLKDLGIYSMVMLTLTADNMDQVIPLADILRDKADLFTFNRLSLVGEGASLKPPDRDGYERFLAAYLAAAESNPVMGYKDNLLNIILREKGSGLFEGCTGYGCGAAFNFLAVLADGEVHACRKFPSRVGNIFSQGLDEIYDSEAAKQYRTRPSACLSCPLCSRCGGCPAVTFSHGLNISKDRDPYCFITRAL